MRKKIAWKLGGEITNVTEVTPKRNKTPPVILFSNSKTFMSNERELTERGEN